VGGKHIVGCGDWTMILQVSKTIAIVALNGNVITLSKRSTFGLGSCNRDRIRKTFASLHGNNIFCGKYWNQKGPVQ